MQRVFHPSELLATEASFEVFNLFNRDNVQDIGQVYGAPEFAGAQPRQFGDHVTSLANPTFSTPTFTGAARQLQFSLRLNF